MTRTRTTEDHDDDDDDDDEDDDDDKGDGDQADDVTDAMRRTRGNASDDRQTWIV